MAGTMPGHDDIGGRWYYNPVIGRGLLPSK